MVYGVDRLTKGDGSEGDKGGGWRQVQFKDEVFTKEGGSFWLTLRCMGIWRMGNVVVLEMMVGVMMGGFVP